jgi:EAL domain-containing protein (putative c-di-GMP-specific phosphodiesterase class I)
VAEGVETMEKMNTLARHDCDELLGYYFSKSLPAETLQAFLKSRNFWEVPGIKADYKAA